MVTTVMVRWLLHHCLEYHINNKSEKIIYMNRVWNEWQNDNPQDVYMPWWREEKRWYAPFIESRTKPSEIRWWEIGWQQLTIYYFSDCLCMCIFVYVQIWKGWIEISFSPHKKFSEASNNNSKINKWYKMKKKNWYIFLSVWIWTFVII